MERERKGEEDGRKWVWIRKGRYVEGVIVG